VIKLINPYSKVSVSVRVRNELKMLVGASIYNNAFPSKLALRGGGGGHCFAVA